MTEGEDQGPWQRIARLLAGELSGEEREEARRELREDEETRPSLDEAEEIWSLTSGAEDDGRWDRSDGWRELRSRIDLPPREGTGGEGDAAEERPGGDRTGTSRRGSRRRRRSSVARTVLKAAAAVLLLAAGWWAYRASPLSDASPEQQLRTYATEDAQRLTLRLADGSSVVLGPESELRVPEQLGRSDTRRVELRGLGYFEVESSPDRPFVVSTPRGAVRALGTKFSARSYATDSTNTVVVEEGTVQIALGDGPDGTRSTLGSGQAAVHSSGRVLSTRTVDVTRQLAWRDGCLTFDDTPLRRVVDDLERWYGVDFEIADPAIAEKRFTGDFSDESIRRIADVLSLSVGARYEVRDSTVILSAPDG